MPKYSDNLTIAYFVSPHGFGHAARASAVIAAMLELDPALRFEIFTTAPAWFFAESLPGPFGYHSLLTDIGLVQKDSLSEDLPETVRRLDDFLPFSAARLDPLAGQLRQLHCRLVLCDIAPLGIAAAHRARIPAVLIENFTWDWIYAGYEASNGRLQPHISYLGDLFQAADYHIQTEPVCRPQPVDLTVAPISRKLRAPAKAVRQALGIPAQARLILLTMGGVPWDYTFLEQLARQRGIYFIIPGSAGPAGQQDNLIFVSPQSGYYHPDLVNACDAIVGKVGYSTLAEVYQAGTPFGYVSRPHFREAPILSRYIEAEMSGLAIESSQFQDGSWLACLPELLALPRRPRSHNGGAAQAAAFVLNILQG